MGWSYCGQDSQGRDIGYGVDATCDQEGCEEEIDRGLAYCCGGMHLGGDFGCGGYFCSDHLIFGSPTQLCEKCFRAYEKAREESQPKAETPTAIE